MDALRAAERIKFVGWRAEHMFDSPPLAIVKRGLVGHHPDGAAGRPVPLRFGAAPRAARRSIRRSKDA